jgi:hypothetical protein
VCNQTRRYPKKSLVGATDILMPQLKLFRFCSVMGNSHAAEFLIA